MSQLSNYITTGMFLMAILFGFSIFVGGIAPHYSESTVDDTFINQYDRMSDLYEQSNKTQTNILSRTGEKDKEQSFNIFDAFGVIKDAFLSIPSIMVSTTGILIGTPTDTQSGGILYVFAQNVGIPSQILMIIISIIGLMLTFTVLRAILGGRI